MKLYCYDKDGLYSALHDLADQEVPLSIEYKPIKTGEWEKKHRQFEAMVNQIAEFKQVDREDCKKDCKIEWGKWEARYNTLTGKKTYKIHSIMSYSLEELKQIIGEMDVWMSERGIYAEQKEA